MNTVIRTLLGTLIAVGLTVSPATARDGFIGEFTATLGEPHGRIIGDSGLITQDIHPVKFIEINGRRVTRDREVLWLKPGTYQIRATIEAESTQRAVPGGTRIRSRSQRQSVEPLELVVEEGMSYFIGGLHLYNEEGGRRQNWQLVLWRVKDQEGEVRYPLDEDEDDDSDDGDDAESLELE